MSWRYYNNQNVIKHRNLEAIKRKHVLDIFEHYVISLCLKKQFSSPTSKKLSKNFLFTTDVIREHQYRKWNSYVVVTNNMFNLDISYVELLDLEKMLKLNWKLKTDRLVLNLGNAILDARPPGSRPRFHIWLHLFRGQTCSQPRVVEGAPWSSPAFINREY